MSKLVKLEDAISAITEKMGIGRTKAKEILNSLPTETKEEWVSVDSDELPPFDIKTQIICADGEQYIGYYNGADNKADFWFCDNNDYHYPTHWMPLPSPPTK